MNEWLFVSGTRLEDCFQEHLLALSVRYEIMRIVMEKLEDIRQHPVTPNPVIVDGEPVHAIKTGQFRTADGKVTPQLVILYILDHAHHFIHLMHICEAQTVDLGGPDGTSAVPTQTAPLNGGGQNDGRMAGGVLREREYQERAAPEPIAKMLRRVLAQASRNRRH